MEYGQQYIRVLLNRVNLEIDAIGGNKYANQ